MMKANQSTDTWIVLRIDESGRTGLEAAIVLIAFVTVAAVFAYSILSAGLFAAERDKDIVYAGLEQSRSTIEEVGNIMATSNDNLTVRTLTVSVRVTATGRPIDFTPNDGTGRNKVVVSLASHEAYCSNVKWFCTPVGEGNHNYLLEPGEQFDITLNMDDLGGNFTNPRLGIYDVFTVQLKPTLGASMTVERSLPAMMVPVINLW